MSYKPAQYDLAIELARKIQAGQTVEIDGVEWHITDFGISTGFTWAGSEAVQRLVEYRVTLENYEYPFRAGVAEAFLSPDGSIKVWRGAVEVLGT